MPVDDNATWGRAAVHTLAACGVRHLALSPGSRSTPVALPAIEGGDIQVHATIDERAMAFHALGLARALGQPVAALTTSGTATGNLHPAIQEARHGHAPLLALTADRPIREHDVGARQVVRQAGIFPEALASFDLGPPTNDAESLRHFVHILARAVATAAGPPAGPVHVNLRFAKPLEPIEGATVGPAPEPPTIRAPVLAADPATIARLQDRMRAAARPLLVLGPHPQGARWVDAAIALARRWNVPVVADCLSQARTGPGRDAVTALADGFLGEPAVAGMLQPDLVLRIGGRPTSPEVLGIEARASVVIATAERAYADPTLSASDVILAEPGNLLAHLDPEPADDAWRATWQRAETGARTALLEDRAVPWEAHAAVRAVEATPPGGIAWVANSLPVRYLERCWTGGAAPVQTLAHHGASGIDGTLAAATGAACTGRPTTVVLGDVALAHDASALDALARCRPNLRIVVLDNGGGSIFHTLPIANRGPAFDTGFLTPPALDLATLLASAGLDVVAQPPEHELRHAATIVRSDGREAVSRYRQLGRNMAAAALERIKGEPP